MEAATFGQANFANRKRGAADLGEEDGVDVGAVLEARQHLGALGMGGGTIDEGLLEAHGVLAQRKDVVTEHDDLVAPLLLMEADQELASLELLRVED